MPFCSDLHLHENWAPYCRHGGDVRRNAQHPKSTERIPGASSEKSDRLTRREPKSHLSRLQGLTGGGGLKNPWEREPMYNSQSEGTTKQNTERQCNQQLGARRDDVLEKVLFVLKWRQTTSFNKDDPQRPLGHIQGNINYISGRVS